MLTKAHRQEALSRAFVDAIAARCGLLNSVRNYDYGIDMTLHDVDLDDGEYVETGHALDIQLRSLVGSVTGPVVSYDLDVRTYNLLRAPPPTKLRILVLVVLPESEAEWTIQTEEALHLHRCAYWQSLADMPETKNRRSVRLQIPRRQIFSVEALTDIMDRVRRGERLWR